MKEKSEKERQTKYRKIEREKERRKERKEERKKEKEGKRYRTNVSEKELQTKRQKH